MKGQYGIEGICLGMPAIVGEKGVERMIEIPLNEEEQQKLRQSAQTLSDVLKEV